jgi:hypothetical protein
MRSSLRVLSFGALAVLFLALPTAGLAGPPKDPLTEPGTGLQVTLPGGPTVVAAQVPGATVGAVGLSDPYAYSYSAGATVVTVWSGSAYYEYNTVATGPILASLGLPAGATLWQIDYYGYTTGATSQGWELFDEDATTGTQTTPGIVTSSTGPGIVHATNTFPSGLTLAPGHEWFVDLYTTSSTSGFVGAVFQYTLPTVSLVPITPVRVFDSRCAGMGGRMVTGAPRTINVKDAINPFTCTVATLNAIPQGARAISFNITVTGTINAGYVTVLPGTSTTLTASTINWISSGAMLANGGIISLGTGTAERQVTLVMVGPSASADVIVDITGYYQ